MASPRVAILAPIAFVPTAWFYRRWRDSNKSNPSRRGELEPMIWTYAAVGTVGLVADIVVQMGICYATTALLFGLGEANDTYWAEFQRSTIEGISAEDITRRATLAASWQNWVFNGVLCYLVSGVVEETLKYLPVAYARYRQDKGKTQQGPRRNRSYIDYALAGALSFAMVENIGFFYAAAVSGHETGARLVFTIVERLFGSLGHLTIACLTALRATRRDYYGAKMSWWAVVGPAMLFHGTSNFVGITASTLEGNPGWIHPKGVWLTTAMLGLIAGLNGAALWLVKREWEAVDELDRQREK
ncbi:MAG: hypothetical protein M4579_005538 [Chaenotheca gracillima]|nr:MAG: hypothetical protein M4579_005538 [Chaenotheca gracillima]